MPDDQQAASARERAMAHAAAKVSSHGPQTLPTPPRLTTAQRAMWFGIGLLWGAGIGLLAATAIFWLKHQ